MSALMLNAKPKPVAITASRITPLLTLFYVILVDYLENGKNKPDSDTALELNAISPEVVRVWQHALPSLGGAVQAIIKGKNKEAVYQRIGMEIKALTEHAKQDQEVPSEDLELFRTFGAFFRTLSPNALTKLSRFASASGSPWVVQRLAPKATDQASTKEQLEVLVKQLVGRADSALTLDEAKQISELKPEEYKTYLHLRKAFNQSWKDALVSYIRKSGKDKVEYNKALNYLKLNGIDHLMSTGFEGFIDDRSRLYTKNGKMIDGMPNAVTFPHIVMNENYGHPGGGDWVFRADRANGGKGPTYYTSDFKKKAAQEKFAKVAKLLDRMPQMRNKWMAQVKKFHLGNVQSIVSVILELLYEYSARIGSLGNSAGGKSTYGIATLLVKHAILDAQGNITLRYKGKDGVSTTHKLLHADPNQKYLVNAIHQLIQDKQPNDRIFTLKSGNKYRGVSPAEVNSFFKAIGGGDTTVHKIRTHAGTVLFGELMQKVLNGRRPKTEKDALAIYKKMGEAVGKKLNHVRRGASGTKVTGTTALLNYIDPSIQIQFFRELGLRIPKNLEKFEAE